MDRQTDDRQRAGQSTHNQLHLLVTCLTLELFLILFFSLLEITHAVERTGTYLPSIHQANTVAGAILLQDYDLYFVMTWKMKCVAIKMVCPLSNSPMKDFIRISNNTILKVCNETYHKKMKGTFSLQEFNRGSDIIS